MLGITEPVVISAVHDLHWAGNIIDHFGFKNIACGFPRDFFDLFHPGEPPPACLYIYNYPIRSGVTFRALCEFLAHRLKLKNNRTFRRAVELALHRVTARGLLSVKHDSVWQGSTTYFPPCMYYEPDGHVNPHEIEGQEALQRLSRPIWQAVCYLLEIEPPPIILAEIAPH